MNYLQKKKLAFMSIVNQVKGFVRTVMGALPLTLEGCVDEKSIIDYKIYGQSVQDGEPTPDNPIEVESVGEKTKNLINWDYLLDDTDITKVDDGYYSEVYYHSFSTSSNIVKQLKSVLKPDVTYTLSRICDKSKDGATIGNMVIYVSGSVFVRTGYWKGLKSATFTITQEQIDNITSVAVYFNTDGEGTTISEVQLTESDTVLPYEPYGKYKIPVTVSGGNLLSPYGWVSGTFNGGFVPSEYNYVVEEVTNYVECAFESTYRAIASNMIKISEIQKIGCKINKNNENAVAVVLQFYDIDGNRVAYKVMTEDYMTPDKEYIMYKEGNYFKSNSDKVSNYTIKSNFIYMRLFLISRQKISGLRIYDFYASKDGDAGYEPYVEPITTNIYLDEPLRKVGDYADYIDFENGKVVRNVDSYTFTGNETSAGGIPESCPCFGISARISTLSLSDAKVGFCNYLYQGVYSNVLSNSRFAFLGQTNHPYVYIYFAKTDFPDLIDYSGTIAKGIIKQWYDNNEPMTLFYNLETPTEQPITLPTIPTFKGTSIVSADTTIQPSNAEIEYYSNVKEW